MTRFQVDGDVYYWESHTKLVSVRTGDVIGRPAWTILNVKEHKLGRLILHCEIGLLRDVALVTVVVMERSDEAREAVIPVTTALTV